MQNYLSRYWVLVLVQGDLSHFPLPGRDALAVEKEVIVVSSIRRMNVFPLAGCLIRPVARGGQPMDDMKEELQITMGREACVETGGACVHVRGHMVSARGAAYVGCRMLRRCVTGRKVSFRVKYGDKVLCPAASKC